MKRGIVAVLLLLAACEKKTPRPVELAAVPSATASASVAAIVDAGPPDPTLFAGHLADVRDFVVASDGIYLVDASYGLDRVSMDGRATTVRAAEGADVEHLSGPIALDDTYAYWGERMSPFGVWRTRRDGSESIQISKAIPYEILSDADAIYVLEMTALGSAGDGTVKRYPKAGGAPKTIVTIPTPDEQSLAMDATSLYWTNYDERTERGASIRAVAKTGGPVRTLATLERASSGRIALDDDSVYFATANELWKAPKKGGRPISLGAPERCLNIRSLAPDGDYVYLACDAVMVGDQDSIRRVDKLGRSAAEELAPATNPLFLRVDADYVYWSDGTCESGRGLQCQLRRLKKP